MFSKISNLVNRLYLVKVTLGTDLVKNKQKYAYVIYERPPTQVQPKDYLTKFHFSGQLSWLCITMLHVVRAGLALFNIEVLPQARTARGAHELVGQCFVASGAAAT